MNHKVEATRLLDALASGNPETRDQAFSCALPLTFFAAHKDFKRGITSMRERKRSESILVSRPAKPRLRCEAK